MMMRVVSSLLRWTPVVLNQRPVEDRLPPLPPLPAVEVATRLRRSMLGLTGAFMSDDGRRIDYAAMRQSQAFEEFKQCARLLETVDLTTLPPAARKGLCINTYNCLILHALCDGLLPKDDTLSRMRLYASASYVIGGHAFSLNDVEHGVLRGNAASPVPLSSRPFGPADPRLPCALPLDPRIHFALNCAAVSCPPISVYAFEEEALDKQLATATEAFLTATVRPCADHVELSMLFKWYGADFGGSDRNVLEWVLAHCPAPLVAGVQRELDKPRPRVVFAPYDWSLNG